LSKKDRSSTSLTIFSLNWVESYQPFNELYQTAVHPALSPDFCHPEWRVKTAGEFGGSGITMWKTRGKYSPSDLAGGGGGRLGEVWFGSFSSTAYSFLMISQLTSGPCSS
jgi:hypothetical protein